MLPRVGWLLGMVLLVSAVLGAQSQPQSAGSSPTQPSAASPAPAATPATVARPTVGERPWTTRAGSPYDLAQAVAAERVRPVAPSLDFPVIEAPPGELPAQPPASGPAAARSATARRWSNDADSPYSRAQAVASEGLTPDVLPSPAAARYPYTVPYPYIAHDPYSPFLGRHGRPVLVPLRRPAPAARWRGGVIYPALPFPPIRGW